MDNTKRKELINDYKNKQVIGGIYCIQCNGNNRKWVKSSVDLESVKSRFMFGIQINACPDPTLQHEWLQYGASSFSFTILEELTKGETQTPQQFAEDVAAMYQLWRESTH